MPIISCPECGKLISDQAEKCPNCGYPLIKETPYQTSDEKQEVEVQKNRNTALILCVFLGYFGAHKFYEGKIGMGILYLCTGGLFCVGWIIDIIDLARKPEKYFVLKKEAPKEKQGGRLKWIIIAIVLLSIIGSVAGGNDNSPKKVENTNLTTESDKDVSVAEDSQAEEPENEEVKVSTEEKGSELEENGESEYAEDEIVEDEISEDEFLSDLKNELENNVAEKAYDILRNQIGFSDLEYEDKMEGLTNYEILADGYHVIVTASDDVYRIFIPNSGYTFYEDGEVKLTASEFGEKTINHDDKDAYYIMAKDIVCSCLKDPRSADFPSMIMHPEEISMQKDGNIVAVRSYVDAKNSFNAKIRSQWTVQFNVVDLSTYSYDLIYVNIDGEEYGTFVEMN